MAVHLPSGRAGRAAQRGFSYLFLLIMVAILGFAAASAVSVGVHASRRDAEYALLAIGEEFEQALRSYRALRFTVVPLQRHGPRSLEDLLLDPRSPSIRRHLRKVYADPLTGRQEWGIVRHPDGSIVGICSLAIGEPIKQSGFGAQRIGFDNAKHYGDWVFSGVRSPP